MSFSFLLVCSKNLPVALSGVEQVKNVGNTNLGEETPLKCQDEEECWLLSKHRVGRSREAEFNKREPSCEDLPEEEQAICQMFAGGKRELSSSRRDYLSNPLFRSFYEPECQGPFCRYRPGLKKKFMVKKDGTGSKEEADTMSSDTNGRKCDKPEDLQDLLCTGMGMGKRSVSRLS